MNLESLFSEVAARSNFRRGDDVVTLSLQLAGTITEDDLALARSSFKPIEDLTGDHAPQIILGPLGETENTLLMLTALNLKLGKRLGELLLPQNIRSLADLVDSVVIKVVEMEFASGTSEIALVREQQALVAMAMKWCTIPLLVRAAHTASSEQEVQMPSCQHIRRTPDGSLVLTTCRFQKLSDLYKD